MRKAFAYLLLVLSVLAWGAIATLPLFDISIGMAAGITTGLIIAGEVSFFLGIALLGKEAWAGMKAVFTTRIRDYTPLLREAIAEARAAGFEAAANDLEQAAFAAFTTSSEMLQEHGLAIERFLSATRDTLPQSIKAKLKSCLTETELASAGWRKVVALLNRRDALR